MTIFIPYQNDDDDDYVIEDSNYKDIPPWDPRRVYGVVAFTVIG